MTDSVYPNQTLGLHYLVGPGYLTAFKLKTLLLSEWTKLCGVLAILSALGLTASLTVNIAAA